MAGYAVYLVHQLRHLDLDLHAVFGAVYAVGGLHSQLAEPLDDVLGFLKEAFGSLDERDAVLGVFARPLEAANLGAHLFRYGESGSVVAGAVDPQPEASFSMFLSTLPLGLQTTAATERLPPRESWAGLRRATALSGW
jgi:hypothetical protein